MPADKANYVGQWKGVGMDLTITPDGGVAYKRVGGAGSVALNGAALGAEVACFGLLGADSFGERVRAALAEAGCDPSGLIEVSDRPTITKTQHGT